MKKLRYRAIVIESTMTGQLGVEPLRTFLVVQWLRLHASTVGGMDLVPDQGAKIYMPHSRGVGEGGWEGDARGRRYGDICICIADSLCYKAETNTPL